MKNTREKMVATTARLLHRQGFQATGLAEVIKASGAPRGSIYHHFPQGKEQLVQEAIAWSRKRLLDYLGTRMREAPSGLESLQVLTDEAIKQLQDTGYTYGCPFAISGLESVSGNESVRAACSDAFMAVQSLIQEQLAREMSDERALELAPFVFSSFQGAFLVSQTTHDMVHLQAFRKRLPELLRL